MSAPQVTVEQRGWPVTRDQMARAMIVAEHGMPFAAEAEKGNWPIWRDFIGRADAIVRMAATPAFAQEVEPRDGDDTPTPPSPADVDARAGEAWSIANRLLPPLIQRRDDEIETITVGSLRTLLLAALHPTPAGDADLIASAYADLRAAAYDALAGWRYIRQRHGDLAGVGWDRVETALACAVETALARALATPEQMEAE